MGAKNTLVVEVKARLEWTEPPQDAGEAAMRAQANSMASKMAARLLPAVQLLVAEMLVSRYGE